MLGSYLDKNYREGGTVYDELYVKFGVHHDSDLLVSIATHQLLPIVTAMAQSCSLEQSLTKDLA